jgi:hypothetical protein
MNSLLKKAVAAVAIKEGIEKIQEMRRPKPSLWSRISPVAIVAALGGALFYLNKNGKLGPVVGQVKDKAGAGHGGWPRRDAKENDGSPRRDAEESGGSPRRDAKDADPGSWDSTGSTSAPSPTTTSV